MNDSSRAQAAPGGRDVYVHTIFYSPGSGAGKGWFGSFNHTVGEMIVEQGDGTGLGRIEVKIERMHWSSTPDDAQRRFVEIIEDADAHACPFCGIFGCSEDCTPRFPAADEGEACR